jgi:hypothetical protein
VVRAQLHVKLNLELKLSNFKDKEEQWCPSFYVLSIQISAVLDQQSYVINVGDSRAHEDQVQRCATHHITRADVHFVIEQLFGCLYVARTASGRCCYEC